MPYENNGATISIDQTGFRVFSVDNEVMASFSNDLRETRCILMPEEAPMVHTSNIITFCGSSNCPLKRKCQNYRADFYHKNNPNTCKYFNDFID